jgi:sporulation integral membrane protein YtvI
MLPFYRKFGRTIFDVLLIFTTVYLFFLLFSYIFNIAMPVFIAIFIFLIVHPAIRFLEKRGMKKKSATNLTMAVFLLLLVGIAATMGVAIKSQVHQLSLSLPKYTSFVEEKSMEVFDFYQKQMDSLSPETVETMKNKFGEFVSKGSSFFSSFFLGTFNILSSISKLGINLVIGMVLAYFLAIEIDNWKNFLRRRTPKTFKIAYIFMKENVIKGIGAYLKAQMILITFTFLIVYISFILMSIDNALTIALFAALLDLLPLIGMPVLFIPWGIYAYLTGDHVTAFALIGIWVFIFIFRQFFEPKIAGDSLGVSAFTMLSTMIVSLAVFGIPGLILTPVLIISIKALYEEGYLSQWIHLPEGEFDKPEEIRKRIEESKKTKGN